MAPLHPCHVPDLAIWLNPALESHDVLFDVVNPVCKVFASGISSSGIEGWIQDGGHAKLKFRLMVGRFLGLAGNSPDRINGASDSGFERGTCFLFFPFRIPQ